MEKVWIVAKVVGADGKELGLRCPKEVYRATAERHGVTIYPSEHKATIAAVLEEDREMKW